ncbi:HAMP domain-containing sensor histidine kinase [Streptomyces sp. MZ04]|uniref:sensor histidine kinase n=1 Tax=Streptomyces sp. MZ04 TaxID=2559236 RepID=UPI00107E6654|nr:HAMP domain-containing sensor histidine kinase [Streptomyces sp. MZ04]TGB12691.1 HAMP domain-containing histidine kinase [Streptomyces sp. MZ04]
MKGLVRRFRSLPLRSRLALLVTSAVALAVAAVAVSCWLLTRAQLRDQMDDSLRSLNVGGAYLGETVANCRDTGTSPDGETAPGTTTVFVQVVQPDGTRCVGLGSTPVVVEDPDLAVAQRLREQTLHDGKTDSGQPVRVLTQTQGNVTVSLSRPLSEIDTPLNRLALLLAFVAGIGVIGAGAAGLWVARTGLRPVDELTKAVEHVARTEDLNLRIPVDGDDEIARLSESFNSMTASLASSRDLQQQLIADAGHELRTPLTSLRTNIELLARSEETGRAIPPDDRKALLASVTAQMTELAALIGDLQELSRTEAGQGGKVQVVALHDIVETALERARLRGPELTFTADLAPWFVRAEPPALERAIVNILDNAVKFGPPGSTVEVALRQGELTVRDHGPGIPPEELPHVFDRFWRSPSARSLPGSGLGLSIVARTVRQAGGEVALRPATGGGTEATVRLPGAAAPPPKSLGPAGAQPGSSVRSHHS